ncbi:hypothetical protein GIB67_022436 [Kingdonia uniflora]|uniref:Uncharacterized protein n=1 Tax=Kingdonia uniflora TaxID=39325 RepID=A0A7J7MTY8_9MAGN|nr:hypothetical protein GIB67_022436 [Kingdonia uniflora]
MVPPRELDDTAQRHQDMGLVVAMLVQEGHSGQALAQRPIRKIEENNYVAFERLPVQDKGSSSIPQDIPINESKRQISQRAKRERKWQLKGDAIIRGVSQRAKVARNLDVNFNRAGIFVSIVSVPTAHTTPTVPSPVHVANDNVLSTEEDLLSNIIPIPPFSHTHETDNFPTLRRFKIGDTLRTRVNMFNLDFNDQCASSEDEDRQRNDIGGVRLQIGRHFLGQMDVRCIHCSILHWLPTLDPLPAKLQELYDENGILSRSFQNYLREYNTANAFTSLGVHMDDRIIRG